MGAGLPGSSFLPSLLAWGQTLRRLDYPGSGPVALGLDDVSQELVEWGPDVQSAQEATEL